MDAANFLYRHAQGPIYGYISATGLRQLLLPRLDAPPPKIPLLHSMANLTAGRLLHARLTDYFAGVQVHFDDIPLDLSSGTPFQQAVWRAACSTPWGGTSTYGALAAQLGKTVGSARAIGGALGANPIAIVVPCHRFLAANGDLVNYAAGLEWKRALLQLEGGMLV
jgi:methylated-DNA-[protein]-cysteine S-methyltransferase